MVGRIPAFLCVDVEPDERLVPMPTPSPSWRGFEALAAAADELRGDLASGSGAPAALSWFLRMDPQVEVAYGAADWVARTYGPACSSFEAAGDELALHVHIWRADGEGGWFNDYADADWVQTCVATSVQAFRAAFGRSARSHRGGDRFFSEAMLAAVASEGVAVDLTLEPGAPEVAGLVASEHSTGVLPTVPAGWSAPMHGPGACGAPVLVPLTAVPGSGTLLLWSPPRAFRALLDARLELGPVSHLAFAVRSEVAVDRVLWQWFRENVRHAAERLGASVEWTTPAAAWDAGRLVASPPPAADVGVDPRVVAHLEAALRDAELTLLHEAEAASRREGALRSERDAVGEDRRRVLETVDGLVAEVDRLRAEVAAYAEERAVLHQERHDLATEVRRLQEAAVSPSGRRRRASRR